MWSCPEKQTGLSGVVLTIPKPICKTFISWTLMSNRLLSAPFLHQHAKMTVVVACAPTDVTDEEAKDAFFDQRHQVVGQTPPHNSGNHLLLLCCSYNLCIADIWFPCKLIYHWAWYTQDGRTRKVSCPWMKWLTGRSSRKASSTLPNPPQNSPGSHKALWTLLNVMERLVCGLNCLHHIAIAEDK